MKLDDFKIELKDGSCVECHQLGLSSFGKCDYDKYLETYSLLKKVSRCTAPHSQSFLESEILSNPLYHPIVCTNGSQVVAFAELYRMPHLGRLFDGRLERVVVADKMEGLGLATKLCGYIVEQAEKSLLCNRVDLTVENPKAKHIYQNKLQFDCLATQMMRKYFPASPSQPEEKKDP
eukprot:Filipodium_phascolosomae@DN2524_c0_g1_i1.p1